MTTTVHDAPDTSRLPRPARRRFPTLLLVIAVVLSIIAAFASYSVVKRHKPTYRSTGAVSFDQPLKLAKSSNAGIIDKLSRLRGTYAGLARTDKILDPVAAEVGIPRGAVASRVFTQTDQASLLLVVGAQSGDSASARRLASAMANEIVSAVEAQQDEAKIPAEDRVTATVVIEPRTAAKVAPTKRRAMTAGVVAGLLVFIGVIGIGVLLRRPTG